MMVFLFVTGKSFERNICSVYNQPFWLSFLMIWGCTWAYEDISTYMKSLENQSLFQNYWLTCSSYLQKGLTVLSLCFNSSCAFLYWPACHRYSSSRFRVLCVQGIKPNFPETVFFQQDVFQFNIPYLYHSYSSEE